ncbi:D-aminoacylase [Flavobacteriaceae bacterium S0825]|uniref:N-acyl-D-amino-acid deacylase family protein n=1 Tax=Gaetbulibacter sp. S0825 TaxID=2720084 RepID=UPI00142FE8AC|nr:D-aminoacylase [Gaetbulibacter sp. S0825]MCK0107849.1 D-aminoacylase [Flavobacteriaceae bacterium S0825]NIX63485.1 D-aminoacylase [Gaetbulibacter sp. S0825]
MNRQLLLSFSIIALFVISCAKDITYDIVIINGQVFDGTGSEAVSTDIGIIDDIIIKIGDLSKAKSNHIIDAKGLAVTPGFIDAHAHLEPIFELSNCESHVRQGVTTSLGGPDGSSPWPFGKYLDSLQQVGVGMNVAYLIGHNTVRRNIMKLDNRPPTDEELEQMKAQISQSMDEGAFGISTGLKYLPGSFSEVEEVIELSKEASAKGGIYTSHLRDEGLGLFDAVNEAIIISDKADIPVVLTHHKVIGKPMWGRSLESLALVDSARVAGLNIMVDQYPYNASYTGISVLIPGWARAGGNKAFIERVSNKKLRDSIKAGIVFNILNDRGGDDLDRVQFAKVSWMPELEGKTLKYWCEQKGLEPTVENGADLVIEAQVNGGASCVFHAMDERDVENILKHPQTMVASDGRLVKPGDGHPHPRWYGTFPRVLGHYVREKKVITLSEAIYKMTALPAKNIGLKDRGVLNEGMKADVTIFNPETIIDKGTFEKPHQYPEGIHYVLVNGQIAIDNKEFKNIKAGKVLRKN